MHRSGWVVGQCSRWKIVIFVSIFSIELSNSPTPLHLWHLCRPMLMLCPEFHLQRLLGMGFVKRGQFADAPVASAPEVVWTFVISIIILLSWNSLARASHSAFWMRGPPTIVSNFPCTHSLSIVRSILAMCVVWTTRPLLRPRIRLQGAKPWPCTRSLFKYQ